MQQEECILTLQTYFHTDSLLDKRVLNTAVARVITACIKDERYNGGSLWTRVVSLEEETKWNDVCLILKSEKSSRTLGEYDVAGNGNWTERRIAGNEGKIGPEAVLPS